MSSVVVGCVCVCVCALKSDNVPRDQDVIHFKYVNFYFILSFLVIGPRNRKDLSADQTITTSNSKKDWQKIKKMTLTFGLTLLLLVAGPWRTLEPVSSANILFLSPITSYSHTHFFFYTIKALASRGHTITHWNGLKPREDIGNVTHLHSAGLQKLNSRHDIGFGTNNPIKLLVSHVDRMASTCRACYKDPVFHQLMASREHFDLIVIEAFMNECMLPMVTHFRAPFIYMSGLPPLPWIFDATCSPMSIQEYPALVTEFTSEMNLIQRTVNIITSTFMVYFRNWFILPKVDAVAREAWVNASVTLPSVREIENKLSLFITNSQPTINYQYFKSSTIVEAGGLHLRPPQPLPKVRFFLIFSYLKK